MRGVVIFSAALMLVPVTMAGDVESYRYVAGTSVDTELVQGAGFCTREIAEGTALGGLCGVEVAPGESLRVRVLDDVNGEIPFVVDLHTDSVDVEQERCADEIEAQGEATIDVPEGCAELSIFIGATGVVGTIVIERL